MASLRTSALLVRSLRSSQYPPVRSIRSLHHSITLLDAQQSPLETKLRDALKTAMKARDRPTTSTIRNILADITNRAKSSPNPSEPLSEMAVRSVIQKGIQQRRTVAESYAPGSPSAHPQNHSDLLTEVSLLNTYLPSSPSTESIQTAITETIHSLSHEIRNGPGAQGPIMKALWEKLGDAAAGVDRKQVGKMVSDALKK